MSSPYINPKTYFQKSKAVAAFWLCLIITVVGLGLLLMMIYS